MPWNELEARKRLRLWTGLLRLGTPRKYKPRSQLFVQGTPPDRLFLIEHGLAKLEVDTEAGERVALALLFPGDWAGLCCACLDGPHFISGTTLTESLIYEVEARRLLEVTVNLPEAAKLLAATLAHVTKGAVDSLLALKVRSGRGRLESLLSDLASVAGRKTRGRQVLLRLPVTNAEIAALISVTPEHLSRIKRELRAEGRLDVQGRVMHLSAG